MEHGLSSSDLGIDTRVAITRARKVAPLKLKTS